MPTAARRWAFEPWHWASRLTLFRRELLTGVTGNTPRGYSGVDKRLRGIRASVHESGTHSRLCLVGRMDEPTPGEAVSKRLLARLGALCRNGQIRS